MTQKSKPDLSLIVADDHPIIRRYLKKAFKDYFGIEQIIETNDGSALLESLNQTVPDLAIIDLEMPKINGYDAILKIHTMYPEIKTIIFSGFLTPETQKRVIHLGAHSTISKNETHETIIDAFRTIINGNRYHSDVSSGIDQKKFDYFQEDTLTVRENEIVDLIVKGYSSKKIADLLGISKWTVDRHRANIRKNWASTMSWNWFVSPWKPMEKPTMSNTHLKRILVVDDEEAILKLLTKVLSRNGYRIDTAGNGEEAIEKIKECRYDCVLTDFVMPGLSGSDVAAMAKALYGECVPVIGMSGTPWLLDCNVFDVTVEKPASIMELTLTIKKMVS